MSVTSWLRTVEDLQYWFDGDIHGKEGRPQKDRGGQVHNNKWEGKLFDDELFPVEIESVDRALARAEEEGRITGEYCCYACGMRHWTEEEADTCCRPGSLD